MNAPMLPFDGTDWLVQLSALRAENAALLVRVAALEAITSAAEYRYGQPECVEGDCDCAADDLDCAVETRHATATDVVVRSRLEYCLDELLTALAADRPADWFDVRDQIETGVLHAVEALDLGDPLLEMDPYRRVIDAHRAECRAIVALHPTI